VIILDAMDCVKLKSRLLPIAINSLASRPCVVVLVLLVQVQTTGTWDDIYACKYFLDFLNIFFTVCHKLVDLIMEEK